MTSEQRLNPYQIDAIDPLDRSTPAFFRRDGTPYGGSKQEQSAAWLKDEGNEDLRYVADTILPNGVFIDTQWHGENLGFVQGKSLLRASS
ncbi:MAG: hypothetical protein AAGD11_07610 [Planctomycetota bacterium]